jgi:hypothetical protein
MDNMLNPYANLKDGERVEWEFDRTHVKEIPDAFNKDKTRIEFKVFDPKVEYEFLWQVSHKWAALVTPFLTNGITWLRVSRKGSGTNDKEYTVEAI